MSSSIIGPSAMVEVVTGAYEGRYVRAKALVLGPDFEPVDVRG